MNNNKKLSQRMLDRKRLPKPFHYYCQHFPALSAKPRTEWMNVHCCFHHDHHPSLSINLISGGFYCFGCGVKGGDVIAFHMQRYHVPFAAAVTYFGAWIYE